MSVPLPDEHAPPAPRCGSSLASAPNSDVARDCAICGLSKTVSCAMRPPDAYAHRAIGAWMPFSFGGSAALASAPTRGSASLRWKRQSLSRATVVVALVVFAPGPEEAPSEADELQPVTVAPSMSDAATSASSEPARGNGGRRVDRFNV